MSGTKEMRFANLQHALNSICTPVTSSNLTAYATASPRRNWDDFL